MRNRFSISLIWLAIFALTANIFAQDFTQSDLPEGTKARLDKDTISEIAYSPDGKHLAVASGTEIWLYDAQTGEELDLLAEHTDVVISIAFSPDSNTLMSGSSDGTVGTAHLWDVATRSKIRTLTEHTGAISIAFSPDGNTLASNGLDGMVLLWELHAAAPAQIAEDINKDGAVNILDLTLIASNFGKSGENNADVNADGMVDILDLTLVAAAFGNIAAAP